MSLPTIYPPTNLLLTIEPLTPAAFAPFGTVITTISQSLTSFPPKIPSPLHPNYQPSPVPANQSTALKTSPVSPLTNDYPTTKDDGGGSIGGKSVSTSTRPAAKGLMSIFSSFPRQNTYLTKIDSSSSKSSASSSSSSSSGSDNHKDKVTLRLKLGILERHPYTTQTFCPFNYSTPITSISSSPTSTSTFIHTSKSSPSDDKTYILIIVAPTLPSPNAQPPNPPDLPHLRAFLYSLNTSSSNVAITYNPGTWHAPMIVLGSRRVDFLVTQFANGVGEDDCQEVLVGAGGGPDAFVLDEGERERRLRVGLGGAAADGVEDGKGNGRGTGKGVVEVDVSFLIDGKQEEEQRLRQRGRQGSGAGVYGRGYNDEYVKGVKRSSKL